MTTIPTLPSSLNAQSPNSKEAIQAKSEQNQKTSKTFSSVVSEQAKTLADSVTQKQLTATQEQIQPQPQQKKPSAGVVDFSQYKTVILNNTEQGTPSSAKTPVASPQIKTSPVFVKPKPKIISSHQASSAPSVGVPVQLPVTQGNQGKSVGSSGEDESPTAVALPTKSVGLPSQAGQKATIATSPSPASGDVPSLSNHSAASENMSPKAKLELSIKNMISSNVQSGQTTSRHTLDLISNKIARAVVSQTSPAYAPPILKVSLHPPSLGSVMIKATVVSGKVDIAVQVSSQSAANALEQIMTSTKETLMNQGIEVGNVSVVVSDPFNDAQAMSAGISSGMTSDGSQNGKEGSNDSINKRSTVVYAKPNQ